ncbi:MAG: hypothetical protein HZR80_03350 [Candidatus Heimdallarchaeota archaeon]
MNGNNNNSKSDVGFLIFLILVVTAMIPFFIGFDNFNKILQISKIIIFVFTAIAVAASVVFGFIFFRKKLTFKNLKKINNDSVEDAINESLNEDKLKDKNIPKIELTSTNQQENILDVGNKLSKIDSMSNDLRKLNQKYDF